MFCLHLNTELFRIFDGTIGIVCLRVGTRDQDTTVRYQHGLGVVHASNNGTTQDRKARANWLSWVVKNGVQVGVGGKAEPGDSLEGSVQNQHSAIW